MYGLLRPFLFAMDPERAHALTLAWLETAHRTGLTGTLGSRPAPYPTRTLGLVFPNPVGLAAGLDNHAIARKLRIGDRAVKAHVTKLLDMFHLHNRTQLALLAQRAGLHPPST